MLERVLGPECEGSIRSDYHGVYISYVKSNEKAWHQACLAPSLPGSFETRVYAMHQECLGPGHVPIRVKDAEAP